MSQTPSSEEKPQVSPDQTASGLAAFMPRTPQDIAVVICALGIVAAFFAPWVKASQYISGATFYQVNATGHVLWILPALAIATIATQRAKTVRRWLGAATLIVGWIVVGHCLTRSYAAGAGTAPTWGSNVTLWFCLGLFAFSGNLRVAAPIDYVAKKLRSRKATVYAHSWTPTPDCHFSTQDFYDKLEKAIRAKQWPGVQLLRLDHAEAGLLSHKREYLRVVRQRQLFDICAATFGKDYFFSVREAEIPAVITLRTLFAVLVGLLFLFSLCVELFGIFLGPLAMVAVVAFAVWFAFNVLKLGLTKVDSLLMQLPVLGPVYEACFRRDTYFQQDTRIFFIHAVNEVVQKHVEEATSAKGLTYLNRFENQPLLDGLYKRSRIELTADESAPAMT